MTSTGKSVGQMKDEHQAFLDEQPLTVLCGLPKCRWKFKGPAAAARAQAEAHRAEKHADLNPRSRTQITNEAAQAKKTKKAKEEAEVKAAKQQRTLARSATEKRPFATQPERRGGRTPHWSQEKCVAAIRDWASRHDGRPPNSKEAASDRTLPTPPCAKKHCGSWADAVEQAGFPRPKRGTRYSRPDDLVQADVAEAERLADLVDIGGQVEKLSKGITETVIAAVRAEHQRESARLATALRRFAGNVLELVQSLDPEEE